MSGVCGTAALLHTRTNRDGDTTDSYDVIGVGDQPQLGVEITGTRWLDEQHPHAQDVDTAACKERMTALAKSIAVVADAPLVSSPASS